MLVEPDGSARVVADGLMFPNGMALADGGATLLVAEMLAAKVTAFSVAADGSLSDRRVFAELPERIPDGIALDADGNLWVASSLSAEALLVAPGRRGPGADSRRRRAWRPPARSAGPTGAPCSWRWPKPRPSSSPRGSPGADRHRHGRRPRA